MASPVFAQSTRFSVPSAGDRVQIAGREQPELAPGVVVVRLPEPVELVEIITHSGSRIMLSPESMFALVHSERKFITFNPPVLSFGAVPPVEWNVAEDESKHREWFLIGTILIGGTFSADWNRPTRLVLPDNGITDRIVEFLRVRRQANKQFDDRSPILDSHVGARRVVTGRVLDSIVGQAIEPKTMRLMVSGFTLTDAQFHAFASGLFFNMGRQDGAAIFQHRDRGTVEHIHHLMRDRAGISGKLVINKMEPTMQRARSVSAPHRVEFDSAEVALAAQMGFTRQQPHAVPLHDGLRLESVKDAPPVGPHPACKVCCVGPHPHYFAANWFLFRPEFEDNVIARRVATANEVFENPSPLAHLKPRSQSLAASSERLLSRKNK